MRDLLFIHGSGNEGAVWNSVREYLSSSYKIYTPDLPGHGSTEGMCVSIDEYSNWIVDYIDKQKLYDVVLIGHSMGGAIVIKTAQYKKIGALIMVDSGLKLTVNPKILNGLKESYIETIKMVANWSFSYSALQYMKGEAVKMMLKNKDVILNDFTACDNYEGYTAADKIKIPSLVVVGDSDVMTPIELAEEAARYLKAEVVKIENSGHMVAVENPKMLSDVIDKFVRSL